MTAKRRRASLPASISRWACSAWRRKSLPPARCSSGLAPVCRRRAAGCLCRRLRRAVADADARGGGGSSGRSALDEFRHRQSGAAGILYGGRARGKIQSQKFDRRGDLSRLGCVVWLGIRHPAVTGIKAWCIALFALPVAAAWLVLSEVWGGHRSAALRSWMLKRRREETDELAFNAA